MKEVSFLQKRDLENAILFTDLNDPNFKPEENGGVDYEAGRCVRVGKMQLTRQTFIFPLSHSFPL